MVRCYTWRKFTGIAFFNRMYSMGIGMLEVRLLGQFEVLRDGSRLSIPTRNAQSLFAYLILNAGKAHRRERLAGLLWPDSSEGNSRSNLRHELWRLRKAIETEGELYFLSDDLTIAFNSHSEYSLDVHRLESAQLEGSTAADLIGALSTYRGELLPGFYDEWVFVERDRLNALYEAKMARLIEILQTEGRWEEVVDWGRRWIAMGSWPESAYRALISAYANTGDIAKAVATYERYAQALQKELGMKPSEQTLALYKRLKTGWKTDARVPQPSLPPTDKSVLAAPSPRVRRSNLPKPLTSFIGREKEIQQIERMVSSARLVTITGSGGVGKTRLAIRVAETLVPQFRDGVWWVELAALFAGRPYQARDLAHARVSSREGDTAIQTAGQGEQVGVDLITQAVAKALRVPESSGQPLLEGIVEYLREKKLLLILDNCEHLIEACAALADRVLGDCPVVTILATSREALGVPGEKAWLLPSLSLPEHGPILDARDIFQSEAVSLFIERTGDVLPGYQPGKVEVPTIAQICLRLDGIPLAIELAAARMNLLSAQEIAVRLGRRFSLLTDGSRTALPRHQTLLAAIEWSHDLLSESEQALFRRLSIFPSSFTLEATEATCTCQEIHREDVLGLIGRLVDKSLVTVQVNSQNSDLPTRYRLLESIRTFGRLKLDEAEETSQVRNRHAEYYTRLVEAAEPELLLPDQVRWFKLLQAENDNFQAMVDWSAESSQAEYALRLVGALWFFWWSQSSSSQGLDLALKALAFPSSDQLRVYRARAHNTAGVLQWVLGDNVSARQSLEEALSLLRTSDDQASLARSFHFLGLVYISNGDFDLADKAFKEGLAITRQLDGTTANFFQFFYGDLSLQKGDRSRAKLIYAEHANILLDIGNKVYAAYPLRRLGYLALEQNDIASARDYFRESLAFNREVSDKRAVYACLASLSALAAHMGKPVVAARLYGAVENGLESLSITLFHQDQVEFGRTRIKLLASLDPPTFEAAITEGWEMSEEQAIELAAEMIGKEA